MKQEDEVNKSEQGQGETLKKGVKGGTYPIGGEVFFQFRGCMLVRFKSTEKKSESFGYFVGKSARGN
jgi:hypothetical protein